MYGLMASAVQLTRDQVPELGRFETGAGDAPMPSQNLKIVRICLFFSCLSALFHLECVGTGIWCQQCARSSGQH